MKLCCSQAMLKQTLTTCATWSRAYPEHTLVSLTATMSSSGAGRLEVGAWSTPHRVGIVAHLPAQVEKPGQVIVLAKAVTEGLKNMHSGQVTLSRVEVTPPPASQEHEQVKMIKGVQALQMESAWSSARGTAATRRIRLRLDGSPREVSGAMPDIACWRTTGFHLANMEPARLRAALAPCLVLAHQRAAPAESAPHTNHALVLVRFDTAQVQWTATTRSAVASSQLLLASPTLPIPFSHALFDEHELTWITTALGMAKHPVTLTLVPQADHQVILLVESAPLTLFCPGRTEPIPFAWEQRLQLPATTAALVPRTPFLQALSFFWKAREDDTSHVQVCITRDLLALAWHKAGDAAVAVEQQIPLEQPAEEVSPILVNLRQIRQLVGLLKGRVIRLELGSFQHTGPGEEAGKVAFLRLSVAGSSTTRLMMTTSRYPVETAVPPNAQAELANV